MVAAGGIAIYLGAVHLGVNRFVIPAPPPDHWWTYPAVFMNAAGAALLEEVIVLAYLLTRLRQMGWSPVAAVLASAVLRGGYHLYQGWGGFAGNFLMGLLFGVLFLRWRRTWPFVVAHFLLDAGAAVGFLLFRRHLPGFSCLWYPSWSRYLNQDRSPARAPGFRVSRPASGACSDPGVEPHDRAPVDVRDPPGGQDRPDPARTR